jgi:hypothetical protein
MHGRYLRDFEQSAGVCYQLVSRFDASGKLGSGNCLLLCDLYNLELISGHVWGITRRASWTLRVAPLV